MFEDFFTDTCNIYHTEDSTVDPGYGIKKRTLKVFGTSPALESVPCHFHVRTNSLKVVQNEPYSSVDGETKLSLPIGTDIRLNDVVENCGNGLKYRAGVPKEIHGGHHIIVTLQREGGVRSAV